ncbi:hypothetical protein HPB49_013638 [Dermacentor silvarum]|uniref:Uncharacterized protein n=1 Tax=Dermacentor silvarum TaxID=543639 RepID=A0ACB8CLA3_DERSI|nr:hypothetical protein HPB49_013638 [Dermacentor silvarum]
MPTVPSAGRVLSELLNNDHHQGQEQGEQRPNWFLVARKKKRSTQAATIPSPAPVPRKTDAHPPPLPFDHYKVVFRPRDGLNLGAWPQPSVAQAIGVAAGLDAAVLNELIIRIRIDQNLAVIGTSDENLTAELQKVQSISLCLNQHAVQAYVAAPDNSCKGVVPGIEPNTTVKTLLENLRCSEAPILHARMMGSTNQALVTFSGIQVPRHVRLYGAELRCYIYRPRQQICSVCLSMGHRADVCPTPDKHRCVACGTSNPLPEHERSSRHGPSVSRKAVSHLDQHVVSLGRLRALCGIRINRQRHQRTPPSSPQLVDAAVDRGRPGNPSKERAADSGHPKEHGQQKGGHNKEQTVSWAEQFPPLPPSPLLSHTLTQTSTQQPTPQPMSVDTQHRLHNPPPTVRTDYCTREALNEMAISLRKEFAAMMQVEMQKMKDGIMAELTTPLQQPIQQALQPAVQQIVTGVKQQIAAALVQLPIAPPAPERALSPTRDTQRTQAAPQNRDSSDISLFLDGRPIPQAMTRAFGDGTRDLQVLYTDAARFPEKPAMCLAVIDNTNALVASATLRTTDSGSAEEGAIALAIVHASTLPSQDAPVTIVTDSQAACRAFAQGLALYSRPLVNSPRCGLSRAVFSRSPSPIHCAFSRAASAAKMQISGVGRLLVVVVEGRNLKSGTRARLLLALRLSSTVTRAVRVFTSCCGTSSSLLHRPRIETSLGKPGSSTLPPSADHEQQQPGQSPLTAPAQDLSNEATTQRPEGVPGASTIGRSAEAHEERCEHATTDQQHRRERQRRKNNRELNEHSRSRHRRERDRSASLSTTASTVSKRTRRDSFTSSVYEDASALSSDEDNMQTQAVPTSSSQQSDVTTPRQKDTVPPASQELFSYASSAEKLEASRDAGGFSQDAFDDYGDGGAWKVQQRKHNQTRPEKETLPEAFVLVVKPRVNVALTTVSSKDLHRNFVTATSAAVNTRPLTYALQPASNTIRLLVYDKRQADGLLKLSQLDVNRGQIPVQVYQAPGRDMCRGVIYNVDCNETKAELRAALTSVCPTCGKTHEGSSAGDECKQTTPKCRNCEEEGHTATDPKCPAKLKSDANLAKKIRSRPRSRRKRHDVHRSRSLRTTVQPHDVKSTQHRLQDENVSTQPRTLKEAVNEIVSKNCAQTTARGSGSNLSYAGALKQTRPSASKPANVSHCTTPMPPSPSQLVDPSKRSVEAEVAELRQQQPCNPQEPTKTQKPASTTITQQTDLALLVQQILHPLLQAQEQHFQRQYGLLQQLFASPLDGPTPHVLQWNCRGLETCAVELNLLFDCVGRPLALLLQETNGTDQTLRKFNGYYQPSIEHRNRKRHRTSQPNGIAGATDEFVIRGQAAVFVRTDIPQTQIDTGQRNTTPDLTLSTPDYVKDWRCDPDAWGSDHYPLWITLNMGRKCAAGRTVRTIRWDAYRRAFAEQPKTASVRERASHALRMATTKTEVRADAPAPDIHMLNLWDARKRAQLMYVENGRRHRDRVRLRRRTAVARRYAKRLAISNVLLKTGQSVTQLQDDAAKTFFPQPSRSPNADIYRKTQPVTDEGLQAPFSLFELEQALSSINARSAAGHDGVTWTALRNLEEYAKKQLLARKLAERMALMRISHFLETEGRFHPAQTGFRPNLGTHDSLLLVKEGVLRRKTVGRGNRHPSILVAVDLRKAFDTVTHEAIIEAAERHGITGRPLNFRKKQQPSLVRSSQSFKERQKTIFCAVVLKYLQKLDADTVLIIPLQAS